MEKLKRRFVGFTLIFLIVGVVGLICSMCTDHWVQVEAKSPNITRKLEGSIYYGLFYGKQLLNYGSGVRSTDLIVSRDIKEMHLMNYGMWIAVVVLHSLAITWGLLAIGFTIYNLFGKPIETLTGLFGLFVWNICSVVCTTISVILFVILFFISINNTNVFGPEDLKFGWISKDQASLSWSFYMNLGVIGCFLINILLLKLSNIRPRAPVFLSSEKTLDEVFIY